MCACLCVGGFTHPCFMLCVQKCGLMHIAYVHRVDSREFTSVSKHPHTHADKGRVWSRNGGGGGGGGGLFVTQKG